MQGDFHSVSPLPLLKNLYLHLLPEFFCSCKWHALERIILPRGGCRRWGLLPQDVGPPPTAPPSSPADGSAETSQGPQWETYESLHSLLAEPGIENMKGLHRSYLTCKFSRLWIQDVEDQLSLTRQELRPSGVYAQDVTEAREERVVALMAAQTTEAEVERLTNLVADLQSQRLATGLP
ncbi:hypothetical protein LIER_38127 [Lithospermum erythrorhizon]|uniref:Uncharacterized protein n=1 Tax=Lithospermum erythrorhizon TaxID=34254 RepID=A0AAV3PWL4_LITER